MAQPQSREEFHDYVLRKIGSPVIQINVSEEQIEDRVDEAVSFWRDYHYNGSQMVYLKHQLTQEDKDGMTSLEKQNQNLIDERKAQLSAVEDMLDEKAEILLHVIKEAQLPEEITGEHIEKLIKIIQ